MGQKVINPIYEPEKLVVGGLYEVRFIDHTTKVVYAHQNGSGNYFHDLLRVGDLFVVMEPWDKERATQQRKCWFSRVNAPGFITTSTRYLVGARSFLVLQIVGDDEEGGK